jgi:hypothetical protein
MFQKKYLNLMLDIAFGFLLPAILVLIFLSPLLLGRGFIFYGDEEWSIFVYHGTLSSLFYAWYNGSPTSSSTLFFSLITSSLISLFGTYMANHIFVFLLPFLSGPLSYFAILWTLRLFGYDSYTARVASMIGSTFYVINWQNPTFITPIYTWGMSYAISPILLFLLLKVYMEHRLRDIIIFSLISTIGDAIPMWIVTIGLFIILSLLIKLLRQDWGKSFIISVKDTAILIVMSMIANAYFFLEAVAGFFYGAGGQYALYSSNVSSVSVAHGSSFLNLFDVFLFGQSRYYFFGLNPQNWTYLNLAIPMSIIFFIIIVVLDNHLIGFERVKSKIYLFLDTSFIRRIRKSPKAGFLLILLLSLGISLFFSKGFNPPLGSIYYLVLLLSPPGILGITRDVGPFLMISALSYAFLFATSFMISVERMGTSFPKITSPLPRKFPKKTLALAVVIILLSTALVATGQETSVTLQRTYSYYKPTYLPDALNDSVSYLDSLNSTGNIMWMPTGGTYPWKNNLTLTDFGANLVENSSNPEYIYSYLFGTNGTSLGKILDLSDTEYLVYNSNASFAFNYPVTLNEAQILSLLRNQTDMQLIYSSGGIFIYRNLAMPAKLYAGTPDIANPYASVFNVSSPVNGSNLYVSSENPYADLYLGHIISPSQIINEPTNFSTIPNEYVGIVKYKLQKTLYDYNSTIFSIRNYSIDGGMINVTINYTIPSYLQKYIGSGKFGPSFSVGAVIYQSGTNIPVYPPDSSSKFEFVESGPSSQKMLNSTSGAITFTFPDENGSISLYYYLGSFTEASPYYYVGSFEDGNLNIIPIQSYNTSYPIMEYQSTNVIKQPSFISLSQPNVSVSNGLALKMNYTAYIAYPTTYLFNKVKGKINFSNYDINIVPMISESLSGLNEWHDSPSKINLTKNNNMDMQLQTPVNGKYLVFMTVNGSINVAGIGNISGQSSFNLIINGSYVLHLHAVVNSTFTIKVSLQSDYGVGNLYSVREISPVNYAASIAWNGTVLIVLPQQYSPMWVMTYNGKEYKPVPLYGGSANGYILNSPHGNFSIFFKMQTPLELGYATSGAFAVTALALVYIYRRR